MSDENKCTCSKEEYIEWGPEWEKEMMKHTKKDLIGRLRLAWQHAKKIRDSR